MALTRFFFDLVGPKARSFDFHGRCFCDPKQADEHARILSFDLSCTDNDEWQGAEVEVRDVAGRRLFSVPIKEIDELRPAA